MAGILGKVGVAHHAHLTGQLDSQLAFSGSWHLLRQTSSGQPFLTDGPADNWGGEKLLLPVHTQGGRGRQRQPSKFCRRR